MISCVPSTEPVSTITQWSMKGSTLSRHRRITDASFLTIMFRQIVWPVSFIGVSLRLEGILMPLEMVVARPMFVCVTLLTAPLELGGSWGHSAPTDAAAVIEYMRTACLMDVALLSGHQPEKLRVDNHSGSNPSIWLHTEEPATGWIIVIVGRRDWCNLAYQFGHELGHVFCNSWELDATPRNPCQWIEEAL